MTPKEWTVLGFAFAIIGVIFFARSILAKRPRRLVEEFFGRNPENLSSLRQGVEAKYYAIFGCAFLVMGFILQGVGLFDEWAPAPDSKHIILEVVGAFLLGVLSWYVAKSLSLSAFRRYLREFFQRYHWPFEKNLKITQEIGKLFGIEQTKDESVVTYVSKVRKTLGVDQRG